MLFFPFFHFVSVFFFFLENRFWSMSWRPEERVPDSHSVWVEKVVVKLSDVEIGGVFGMLDPESDSFTTQRVLAVNRDHTLTVQDTWTHRVRNVKVDVLVKPDYLALPENPTHEVNTWGFVTPRCPDEFNHRFG